MKYQIQVTENSRHMDKDDGGAGTREYETAEEMLAAARAIVDADLMELHSPGMLADELYRRYRTFGRDALVVSDDPAIAFSAWGHARERATAICDGAAPSADFTLEWFRVSFDDLGVRLQVDPPHRSGWEARIAWERINRICFKAGDFFATDELYIFTDERPESYLIPIDAAGAPELWNEILRRNLFDAELAIRAASSVNELFCDPEGK